MSGIKCQVMWIIMDYHIQIKQGKKYTFCYFLRMLKSILVQDYGLFATKIQPFPLLLLAPPGTPAPPRKATSPPIPTPGSPHRRRGPPVGDDLRGILKKALQLPPPHRRPQADDDDEEEEETEENKENTPPPPENPQDRSDNGPLHQLLKKWGEDIDHFRHTIWTDLEDFKKKLGIHLLSV
uniref:E4 protein n=1 Tax=Human papillomavirus TaxID=10566 RepID=A0A385PJT3_9PAPI|nr:MAG: E4 protein [Human papillomavirus]